MAYELARNAEAVAIIERLQMPPMTWTRFYAEWQRAGEDSAADFPC